ncbi:hypothetical protein GE118_01750 [Mycoplasma sp. NEAQ87857]|uniref:hypothetical protein n=1 Tax=Mycoplasma sp. NEAQ87857 TaxID=2683967 RepID=UPI001316483E|nr:hypothetical protein [Mycoplasma sp. NEAQ87857]QGZ97519.1 hypothetical protein GE118_01750 [Mycoplasma sp. NEAQ87857]
MIEWYIYISWIAVLTISYLIANYLNTHTLIFAKIKTWIFLLGPFLLIFIIGLPMVIAKVNFNITLYATSYPCMFFFGIWTAVFLERWNKWKEHKTKKLKEAKFNNNNNKGTKC